MHSAGRTQQDGTWTGQFADTQHHPGRILHTWSQKINRQPQEIMPWMYKTQQNQFLCSGRRYAGHSQVYSSAIEILSGRFMWPHLSPQRSKPNQTMGFSNSLSVQPCSTPAQLLISEHLKWVPENLCSARNSTCNLDRRRTEYCEIRKRSHAIRSQGCIRTKP